MISSISEYYNKNYSYKSNVKRSSAASAFQIDYGLEMKKSGTDNVKTITSSLDNLDLKTKADLIHSYRNLNWSDEKSMNNFLQKGVKLGFYDQQDMDEACWGVEDPNLLNKVSYIPNENDNNIKRCLEYEKAQLKMAIDFYHNVPGALKGLEEHISSLAKVSDFIDQVSALE